MVRGDRGAEPNRDCHRQEVVQPDSESIRGISSMGMQALTLFYQTEESREGVNAFLEKRPPKFRKGS